MTRAGSASTPKVPFDVWFEALERRHRAALTFSEIRRSLQALSSLYVERRYRLPTGAAFDGAGKRAAFALYYGPLHFLQVREVVRALGTARRAPERILDLGCGTGVAGAAWALEAGGTPFVEGIEQSGWAVDEARWTLGRLHLKGSVRKGDLRCARFPGPGSAIVAAFTLNEVPDRDAFLPRLLAAGRSGCRVLIVEPVARRIAPWWSAWTRSFTAGGGRHDVWRFPADLPQNLAALGRAACLDPKELTARSLYLGPRVPQAAPPALTRARRGC